MEAVAPPTLTPRGPTHGQNAREARMGVSAGRQSTWSRSSDKVLADDVKCDGVLLQVGVAKPIITQVYLLLDQV